MTDFHPREIKPLTRHKIRERVMQCLYSVEVGGLEPDEVYQERLEPYYQVALMYNTEENAALIKNMFYNTLENKEQFDEIIRSNIINWDVNRLPMVEKLFMRMAIYEFLFEETIPFPVTIDEYVKLTKRFSEDNRAAFMNAVLDNIRKNLKIGM